MIKEILKKSWQISRTNPILWLFAFFSLPLIYNELNIFSQIIPKFSKYFENFIIFKTLNQNFFTLGKIKNLFINLSLLKIIVSLGSLILVFVIATFFESWLICHIKNILKKENKNIKNIIHEGNNFFWPLFGLNLIALFFIFGFFFLFSSLTVNLLTKSSSFFSNILFILIFIFLTALLIFIIWLIRFSIFTIIFKRKRNIFSAVKSSTIFIYKNWLEILYLLLSICLITIIVNFIIFVISLTSSIPMANLSVYFYHLNLLNWSQLFFVLNLIFLIIITSFIAGIFATFQMTSWIIFYYSKNRFLGSELIVDK